MKKLLISVFILAAFTGTLNAQGKVWGLAFADYFYKVSGDTTPRGAAEYSGYAKDFNTFEFRRLFLGYDHTISENFAARFVISYEGRDFTSAGNRGIFVKNAELTWKNIYEGADLTFGITGTPGFGAVSESIWGYRSIEKTASDMRGIIGSRDLGLLLKGTAGKEKNFGYQLMIGNGTGTRLENNKYKRFYSEAFTWLADRKIVVDAFADYEKVTSERDKITLKGFLGLTTGRVNAGLEVYQQMQNNFAGDTADIIPFGISGFINASATEKVKFFARYDFFNPDTETENAGFNEHFITAGIDFMPVKNVHIMPNLWMNSYQAKGTSTAEREADIVPRLTLWYIYQ